MWILVINLDFFYVNCGNILYDNTDYFFMLLNEDFVYIYGNDSSRDSVLSSEGPHIALAPL